METSLQVHQGANSLAAMLGSGRTLVMGVLNITPDSFSDGGRYLDAESALAHAQAMVAAGADLIDIGAESTRPYGGMAPVTAQDELSRLGEILPAIVRLGIPVSIDTMKAEVAAWALDQGAAIANDVWGLQRDGRMADVVAKHGVPVVAMHNRETVDPALDIMADMEQFFTKTLAISNRAGIQRDHVVLDPGIGFGKTPEQSVTAIRELARLKIFGLPILVGASRKRFIDHFSPAPPDRRLGGSIAAHVLAVANGAAIIRAHDVAETVQALRIALAIRSRP